MNKILVGLIFGLVLGALDGATAMFYPETRPVIGGILIGSSFKGMLVGLLAGWFARKVQSTGWGIAVGSALGLLFAFLVAFMDARVASRIISKSCFPASWSAPSSDFSPREWAPLRLRTRYATDLAAGAKFALAGGRFFQTITPIRNK